MLHLWKIRGISSVLKVPCHLYSDWTQFERSLANRVKMKNNYSLTPKVALGSANHRNIMAQAGANRKVILQGFMCRQSKGSK